MTLYLISERDGSGAQRLWIYFFIASALKCIARLIDTDAWKQESRPSPWRRFPVEGSDENGNVVWMRPGSGHIVELIPMALAFRDWSLKRWIRKHLHWQNLNEKGNAHGQTITGSILRHGRAWFRYRRFACHWSWNLWAHFFGADVRIGSGDSDRNITFFVACGLFALWFTLDDVLPKRVVKWGAERAKKTPWMGYEYMAWPRQTGFSIHHGSVWVEIWNWDAGWSKEQPKWMAFNFSPVDFLLGEPKYAHKKLASETRTLTMPEAVYSVDIELAEDSWKRPRWPWAKKVMRAHIECPGGIPTPGKGENSWDCGEDATFGLTCQASSFRDALTSLYSSVMRQRERYGGPNWRPSKPRIAQAG